MKFTRLSLSATTVKYTFAAMVTVAIAIIGVNLLGGSHAAVPTTPTVPVCGEREASDVEEYNGPSLPNPAYTNEITPPNNGGIVYYRYWAGANGQDSRWYMMTAVNNSSATFSVYDATNDNLLNSFTINIPSAIQGQQTQPTFAVDPSGNIYLGTYATASNGGAVSQWKWSPGSNAATEGWTAFTSGQLTGAVYGYTDSSGTYRIAAAVNASPADDSVTYNASSGASMSTNAIYGTDIQPSVAHNNDIIAINNGTNTMYVWNSTATTQNFYMSAGSGSSWSGNISGANELANGDLVVASYESRALFFFNGSGGYIGSIGADTGDGQPLDYVNNNATVEVVNNRVYYTAENPYSTPNKLTYVTVANINAYLASPQGAPFHLGLGANLSTSAADNYFTPGSTPSVNLTFTQWWQATATSFTGTYTIRSISQILNNQPGTQQAFSIPTSSASYVNGTATIPLTLPSLSPGPYEVNAQLVQNGATVSATCIDYSIGASNDTFNPASVPSGNDSAGVYDANQLGQRLFRSTYTIDDCFPGITTPTASTALNCPASMDSDISAAVKAIGTNNMIFDFQLGTGTTFDENAISSGQWQRLIGLVVAHFPEVTHWECWNEPDNNSFSSPTAYVSTALEPCYNAVKAVSNSDLVIGISNENYSVSNYQGYVNAGALNYLDIVAFHSYTGWNKSWEEQGNVIPSIYDTTAETGVVQQLQSYLSSKGYNGIMLDTESGFWNNNASEPYNYYDQGDKLVRKWVLEQSVGIDYNSNFFNNADYTVDNAEWSLIGGQQSGVLNPGGLAAVNFHAELGGRTFLNWLPTNVPHTYAALFGPSATSNNDVAAVWADDFSVSVIPELSGGGNVAITSEYGDASTQSSGQSLTLTGQMQYLSVPQGQTIQISPGEAYGTNYALLSQGAKATSSSVYSGNGCNTVDPNVVLSGIDDAEGSNYICDGRDGTIWSAAASDTDPTLTVSLKSPQTIDRVFVSSLSIGSSLTGLRNYLVQVNNGNGTFTTVATITNEFYNRNDLISFPAQTASQIRITNMEINYSGYGDGLPPVFWNSTFNVLTPIYDIEAYGPSTAGTGLSTEAESGILAGGAEKQANSTASGGEDVLYPQP
jgi:hypothetical protein